MQIHTDHDRRIEDLREIHGALTLLRRRLYLTGFEREVSEYYGRLLKKEPVARYGGGKVPRMNAFTCFTLMRRRHVKELDSAWNQARWNEI